MLGIMFSLLIFTLWCIYVLENEKIEWLSLHYMVGIAFLLTMIAIIFASLRKRLVSFFSLRPLYDLKVMGVILN